MKKVFLGGTCNNSNWRDKIIIYLKKNNLDYFNPVVNNWTSECMKEEIKQRKECDFCLYTITPKMTGVYSIAEVVDDSNKNPLKTILVLLQTDGIDKFNKGQWKSLLSVQRMVENNGCFVFYNLLNAANYIKQLSIHMEDINGFK